VLDAVLARVPLDQVALHFHDTRGTALANVLAALDVGVTTFDASAGGLGGCPFAPGATGNLATEDLLYMLDGLGIDTGVALDAVLAASRFMESKVGHPLASRYAAATPRR
jgi:hydroxymethylglutaryl-CoA lyase